MIDDGIMQLVEQIAFDDSSRFFLIKIMYSQEQFFGHVRFVVYNGNTIEYLIKTHPHLTITLVREVTDKVVTVNDKIRIAEEFEEAYKRVVS